MVIALAVILVFGGQGLRNQLRSGSMARRQMLGGDVPLATQLRLRQEHDDGTCKLACSAIACRAPGNEDTERTPTCEAEARGRMVPPVSLMTARRALWRGTTGGGGEGGGGEGGGAGGGDGGGAAGQRSMPISKDTLCHC